MFKTLTTSLFFIKGLSYKLNINSSEFSHAVSKQSLNVLPYDEEQMLTVTLVSNALGLIKHLNSLNSKQLKFRLSGHISHGTVANSISLYSLPFEKSGTLDLSNLQFTQQMKRIRLSLL